jgi:ribosomal 50S subunit-recycling heat shock protein
MAGQLDSLFRSVAKSVVATLGDSLDHTITYTKKGVSTYNVETGEDITVDTTYSDIKVPISFIRSEEEGAQEMRAAKLYITPDLIGDNQPSLEDEITLSFAGSDRVVQIVDIDTKKGGQTYLFILLVRF